MKLRAYLSFLRLAQRGRDALRRRFRRPVPGRFQAYSFTLPDRYPWLFDFARTHVRGGSHTKLLSFGCSRGDEVFTLRNYFPDAQIKGIDIGRRNIACCEARLRAERVKGVTFELAADTQGEPSGHYDAIFCLAVLCLGDLTVTKAQRCDPYLYFRDFDRMVSDFARCLRPGGILFLLTTNFRFSDTTVAPSFDVVLEADLAHLAPDVLFDVNNALLDGERYRPAAFRKRSSEDSAQL